ncbi:hypothetical protein HYT23_05720 [Candidatus Pacearchaeota archaeon]|nr:hypothetical protein [Candidatus Pacearchaeota archaeon]
MNKGGKGVLYFSIFLFILIVLVLSTASAGFFDFFKAKITGKATSSPVTINITVSGTATPSIVVMDNQSMTSLVSGPTEGPTATTVSINLTAYDADGFGDINDSDLRIYFTLSGESTRSNTSCLNTVDFGTYYANFTCKVTMYWLDGSGTWTITANVSDSTARNASNTSANFFVGALDAFAIAPTTLTWGSITAGATNQNASNNPLLLNNTGNINKNISVNTTNLRGETNPNLALWAGNFSISAESACRAQNMTDHSFLNITSATLPKGNFTINNGTAGQEKITVCLNLAGSELTAQSYSTANSTEGTWTVKIVTAV